CGLYSSEALWENGTGSAAGGRLVQAAMAAAASVRQQNEVRLGHAAVGTNPVFGNVFEAGAGGQAVFRHAGRFVVDQAAGAAHPLSTHAARASAAAASIAWISLRRCLSAGVTMATNTASRCRRCAGWRIR